MLFFLTFFIPCSSLDRNRTLLLQTYSCNSTGIGSSFFKVVTGGASFEDVGITENNIRESPGWGILFPNPFHQQSSEHNYRMIARHLLLNSSIIRFSPELIEAPPIEVFTTHEARIYIENIMENHSLTIKEVITPSRNIFIYQAKNFKMRPASALMIKVYICPVEPGIFRDVIFVQTSFGSIPYIVSYEAYGTEYHTYTQVIYHSNVNNRFNVSIRIPANLEKDKVCVIYDSHLFNSTIIQTKTLYIFPTLSLSAANYVTFIHLVSKEKIYTFPITILISTKPLQSYDTFILTPTVTSRFEISESNITLVNPNFYDYKVTNISLLSSAPSNVKIVKEKKVLKCSKLTYCNIGKVIVSGEIEGDVSTSIKVEFFSKSGQNKYEIYIPVKGLVAYGNLSSSESLLNFKLTSQNKFRIINYFKSPVIVYAVYSQFQQVYSPIYDPFLLKPNEQSKNNYLFLSANFDKDFDSYIYVETNVTTLKIPMQKIGGRVSISDPEQIKPGIERTIVTKELGEVLIRTLHNFSIMINNPSATPFKIHKLKATPCIKVINNHTFIIPPFSNFTVNLQVLFLETADNQRTDQITLHGNNKCLLLSIVWIPINGSIIVTEDVDVIHGYGMIQTFNISLHSTYKKNITIFNFSTFESDLNISMNQKQIDLPYNSTVKAGRLTLGVTKRFIKGSIFEKLLSLKGDLKDILLSWNQTAYNSSVDILCQISPSSYVPAKYSFIIHFTQYSNIEIDVGKVLIGSYRNSTLAIPNNLDMGMKYIIVDNDIVDFEDKNFELETESIGIINFLYYGKVLGRGNSLVTILTNSTPPFFANISGIVVDIKLNVEPNDILCEITSIYQFWVKKNVTITNRGEVDARFTEILLTVYREKKDVFQKEFLSLETNCPKVLSPNESCVLYIKGNIWSFKNGKHELVIQSMKTRKIVKVITSLKIDMSQVYRLLATIVTILLSIPTFIVIRNKIKTLKMNSIRNQKIEPPEKATTTQEKLPVQSEIPEKESLPNKTPNKTENRIQNQTENKVQNKTKNKTENKVQNKTKNKTENKTQNKTSEKIQNSVESTLLQTQNNASAKDQSKIQNDQIQSALYTSISTQTDNIEKSSAEIWIPNGKMESQTAIISNDLLAALRQALEVIEHS